MELKTNEFKTKNTLEKGATMNIGYNQVQSGKWQSIAMVILLLVSAFWGTGYLFTDMLLEQIGPFQIISLRFAVSTLVLMTIVTKNKKSKRKPLPLSYGEVKLGVVLGILLFFSYTCQTMGLMYGATQAISSFITSANVAIVPLAGLIYSVIKKTKDKKPTIIEILGAIIALVGVGFMSLKPGGGPITSGDIMTVGTMISFGVHIFYNGFIPKDSNLLGIVTVQNGVCAFISLISALSISHTGFSNIQTSGILIIMYMGIVTTTLCYFLQAWAQQKLSGNRTAIILSTECIFATVISLLRKTDALTMGMVIASVLILTGVIISQKKQVKGNAPIQSYKRPLKPIIIVMTILLMASGLVNIMLFTGNENIFTYARHISDFENDESTGFSESETPPQIENETPTKNGTQLEMNLEILREKYKNEDIIGYLDIENTSISYPVVQTNDNSFYLRHDIYKKPDNAGWIFLDYENDLSNDDMNIIIYGHNMREKIRFHDLRYYDDPNYLQDHPVITFNTIYGFFRWEIFTFFETYLSFQYIDIYRKNDEKWRDHLAQLKSMSKYETGVEVTGEDRIVLLSTSTNRLNDWRYVIGAKLIIDPEPSEGS